MDSWSKWSVSVSCNSNNVDIDIHGKLRTRAATHRDRMQKEATSFHRALCMSVVRDIHHTCSRLPPPSVGVSISSHFSARKPRRLGADRRGIFYKGVLEYLCQSLSASMGVCIVDKVVAVHMLSFPPFRRTLHTDRNADRIYLVSRSSYFSCHRFCKEDACIRHTSCHCHDPAKPSRVTFWSPCTAGNV